MLLMEMLRAETRLDSDLINYNLKGTNEPVTFSMNSKTLSGKIAFYHRLMLSKSEARTILTDTTNGDAEAGVEVAVLNQDVGTIRFHRNRVIAVINRPSTEGDIIGVYCICTVCLFNSSISIHRSRINDKLTLREEKSKPTVCSVSVLLT